MIGLLRAHRRAALYAALALTIPLPAFALSGEEGDPGGPAAPVPLSVTASLDGCGLAETSIVCTIDASYGSAEGATSYTASVTAPNGSVTDFGTVAPGGTTLTVPYSGNGTYSVRITAYGDPPGPEESAVIDTATSDAGESDGQLEAGDARAAATAESSEDAAGERPAEEASELAPSAETAPAATDAAESPPAPDTGTAVEPAPAPAECTEEPAPEPVPGEEPAPGAPAPTDESADAEPQAGAAESTDAAGDAASDC